MQSPLDILRQSIIPALSVGPEIMSMPSSPGDLLNPFAPIRNFISKEMSSYLDTHSNENITDRNVNELWYRKDINSTRLLKQRNSFGSLYNSSNSSCSSSSSSSESIYGESMRSSTGLSGFLFGGDDTRKSSDPHVHESDYSRYALFLSH